MAAAVDDAGQADARALGADVERADALRAVNLVGAHRQQVDPVALHVHRDLADGLHGVAMEHDALFLGDPADLARSDESCRSRCWPT